MQSFLFHWKVAVFILFILLATFYAREIEIRLKITKFNASKIENSWRSQKFVPTQLQISIPFEVDARQCPKDVPERTTYIECTLDVHWSSRSKWMS